MTETFEEKPFTLTFYKVSDTLYLNTSHLEKGDLLEAYIVCQKNSHRPLEHYNVIFPKRMTPAEMFFHIIQTILIN